MKALDISSSLRPISLLEVLAILSDNSVRKSKVDREDLKPYWKLEKSLLIKKLIINKPLKVFTDQRKKTNIAAVFCCRPLPNILKNRDHKMRPSSNLENKVHSDDDDFDILKISASMYEKIS